ncbi:hypothetical protein RUM43_011111 [Polyplax serrata]|uniref:Microtubule-associated protein Jupiter n=1 Tax=Polyplax serrata TaxID=468196 RepID=A0AAN8NLK7_POLSC
MKPPGGDCHDIFGADFIGTPSHHRVLKPPGGGTSELFATNLQEANQKPGLTQVDSSGNLPNGIDLVNGKSGKTTSYSSLSEGHSTSDVSIPSSVISAEIKNLSAQIQKRQNNGNPLTGEGCQTSEHYVIRVHRQREGNPVTGEGYDTPESRNAPPPARTRVPPGGYSSGLW